MSATVITGKSGPYGSPVAGSSEDGPVVPRQPPSRFVEMTKKRSVSKALPGPIIPSHQPSPLPAAPSRSSAREPVAGALRRRRLREAGGVGVAAERVADQDDIVAPRGERAVGLVGHPDRVQLPSAVERHRIGQVEVVRLDGSDRAGRGVGAGAMSSSLSVRPEQCIVYHSRSRNRAYERRGARTT